MRYIVYGAGGVGSVLGGFMHRAGLETVLVARPPHVRAIGERGLHLISERGRWHVPVPAVERAEQLRPFRADDVVLLTAKSQHTAICLGQLARAGASPTLPVFSLQNGIWNESYGARVFPRFYGAMIIIPGYYMQPGEAVHWFTDALGYLDIGSFPAGVDQLAERVAADIAKAGFVTRTHERVMESKAGKALANLANAMAAIDGDQPETSGYLRDMQQEAMDVWEAGGIPFERHDAFRSRIGRRLKYGYWRPPEYADHGWGGSGWQTLARRAGSSETPFLNGDVCRIGRLLGIPCPANEALTRLSVETCRAGKPPASVPFRQLADMRERLSG